MIEPDISLIGKMLADASRTEILLALMSGKALTTTELAIIANISTSTASIHISKLSQHGLIICRKQGKHKYSQLANHTVAELLERLLVMSTENKIYPKTGPNHEGLAFARTCYDHLAGTLSVQLFSALLQHSYLTMHHGNCQLTALGKQHFINLGCNIEELRNKKRPVCRQCLDWSERCSHLSGSLGSWILTHSLNKGWASKDLNSRQVWFNSQGLKQFKQTYKIDEKMTVTHF